MLGRLARCEGKHVCWAGWRPGRTCMAWHAACRHGPIKLPNEHVSAGAYARSIVHAFLTSLGVPNQRSKALAADLVPSRAAGMGRQWAQD